MQAHLHLVEPLGFSLDEKSLRRAGLDYWPHLDWSKHPNLDSVFERVTNPDRVFYMSTKAEKSLYDLEFCEGDWFVFGKETKGLPESLLKNNWGRVFKIPFPGPIRSFNLSNAVAMVLGEGLRQL